MISDERLREAARQAEKNLLDSLPEPEDCEATFSSEYKRKMKKLVRCTDHPIRYWVQKAVACILLVILLGGGSVLALSTEARAAFVGWIREVYETWFVYKYEGEDQELPQDVVFQLTWLPEGFIEIAHSSSEDQISTIYEDENSDLIMFIYARNMESSNLYVEEVGVDTQIVQIGHVYADLYLDQQPGGANTLVWSDRGVLFWLYGNCSGDVLIKIAENICIESTGEAQ